jgi:hypothetical protein
LEDCLAKPSKTYNLFAAKQSTIDAPETYRDNLVAEIHRVFQKKTRLFWKGDMDDKGMLIIRWKLLMLNYEQPDRKVLLSIKGRHMTEVLFEVGAGHETPTRQNILPPSSSNSMFFKRRNFRGKPIKPKRKHTLVLSDLQDKTRLYWAEIALSFFRTEITMVSLEPACSY